MYCLSIHTHFLELWYGRTYERTHAHKCIPSCSRRPPEANSAKVKHTQLLAKLEATASTNLLHSESSKVPTRTSRNWKAAWRCCAVARKLRGCCDR